MSHWDAGLEDKFHTRSKEITEVVQVEPDGYFMCSNGFWYDMATGRDGWCVQGTEFPHPQDLREKVK